MTIRKLITISMQKLFTDDELVRLVADRQQRCPSPVQDDRHESDGSDGAGGVGRTEGEADHGESHDG